MKATRGHELERDLMTEEFKMFGTFPMYWSISRYATAKGQTNHAQADQILFFQCSLLEQCSEWFPFAEMNIFAWWAKIVSIGSYRPTIYCLEKITDRRLARKSA